MYVDVQLHAMTTCKDVYMYRCRDYTSTLMYECVGCTWLYTYVHHSDIYICIWNFFMCLYVCIYVYMYALWYSWTCIFVCAWLCQLARDQTHFCIYCYDCLHIHMFTRTYIYMVALKFCSILLFAWSMHPWRCTTMHTWCTYTYTSSCQRTCCICTWYLSLCGLWSDLFTCMCVYLLCGVPSSSLPPPPTTVNRLEILRW